MASSLENIEHDALFLSRQERAFLADRLLSSLDGDSLTDVDAAWLTEAEKRYEGYKEGKRPGVAAESVFAEADKLLR